MATPADSIRTLRSQRRAYRKQLQDLATTATDAVQQFPIPIHQLQGHLSSFDYLTSMVQDLDHQLLPFLDSDDAIETNIKESNDLFQSIRVTTALVRHTLASVVERSPEMSRRSVETAIHTPTSVPQQQRQFPKLPQLHLPQFSGDVLQWTSFWDSYESGIHSSSMPAVDKFNYLKSLLHGVASDAISGISVSNDTYDTAVTIITQRFGQKQLIINAHVESLINIPMAISVTTHLRKLYDSMEIHIRGLETLGITATAYGAILTPILLSKLPSDLKLIITRKHGSAVGDLNILRDLLKCEIEARELSDVPEQHQQLPSINAPDFSTGALVVPSKVDGCVFCKSRAHSVFYCRLFASPSARKAKVIEERRCFNCLRQGHDTKTCPTKQSCRSCGFRHHTSFCTKTPEAACSRPSFPVSYPNNYHRSNTSVHPRSNHHTFARHQPTRYTTHTHAVFNYDADNSANSQEAKTVSCPAPALLSTSGTIFMQTALTKVKDHHGIYQIIRLLFDTGSQRSYISSRAVNLLGLKPNASESLSIAPFGQQRSVTKTYSLTNIVCSSLFNTISHTISTIIVPTITQPVSRSSMPLMFSSLVSKLQLSDPPSSYEESLEIDVLVGLDNYWDIVGDPVIRILNTSLTAIPSSFGYLLSGKLQSKEPTSTYSALCVGLAAQNAEDFLTQFWESETFDVSEAHVRHSTGTDPVLLQFEDTIRKTDDRYEVRLPWKQESPDLPTNYHLAHDRFQGLVKRLERKDLISDYNQIIQQQLNGRFIEAVCPTATPDGVEHYIAHHPVIKVDHATTKVRIVYDASAKLSPQHNSLNDCLHPGPNLLNDIHRLLLQFRTFEIVLLADIEKAFLQVGLSTQDRDATRFFWLKDHNSPPVDDNIQIYRFCRVPFGATSSPFLLAATLRHHLNQSPDPVVKSLATQFYVDNLVIGATSVSEAKRIYQTSKQSLRDAGMNLREWISNSKEFINSLPSQDKAKCTTAKVLGVSWNIGEDSLHCKSITDLGQTTPNLTKQHILQTISKVFDPLGLLSPVIIPAKIFIQDLWKYGIEWDNQISPTLFSAWKVISEQLRCLSDITIPRFIPTTKTSELHVFVDASQRAYGAVAYIRSCNVSNVSTQLLYSKSRVAPVKEVTIPRLELIAAVMGCKLAAFAVKCIPTLSRIHIWSDSQIVLHWIKKTNQKLDIFVKNRVNVIRSYDYVFAYCSTSLNPADLCTRGSSTAALKDNNNWWNGPPWLSQAKPQWPEQPKNLTVNTDDIQNSTALKTHVSTLDIPTPFTINPSRYNSLLKLLHVTSYCNRFVTRLRDHEKVFPLSITAEELDQCRDMWITWLQQSSFPEEIRLLHRNLTNPFIKELRLFHSGGILRCQGRFQRANVPLPSLNPILLPKNNYITDLVIMDYHKKLKHQGVRHTLSTLRQHFWVPNARQQVKSILRKCFTCRYWNGPSFPTPVIPQLPASRVTQAPPFSYTGCDFAGPVYVFDQDVASKAYICLFTCAVTRAIHLELVGDMSTGTFILALKRFISRRGVPTMMISDNARTFKLTKSVVERLWLNIVTTEDTVSYIASQGIQWRFNVERAPWWGGFFERLVGLVKRCLEKAAGKIKLSTIHLTTLLTEIEAILNSRPLTYVYTDTEAGEPLTPNNFLLSSCPGIPTPQVDLDHDFEDVPATELLSTLHRNQKVLDYYWSIWHNEYLHQLREYHHQWQKKTKSFKLTPTLGDVVLVKEEGQKRGHWKLGIIQQVYPGSDGNIRSAKVKCKSSVLNRPVSHLYPLELNSEGTAERIEPMSKDLHSSRPKRQSAQRAATAIHKQLKDWDKDLVS